MPSFVQSFDALLSHTSYKVTTYKPTHTAIETEVDCTYLSVNRVNATGENSNFSSQLRTELHCASPIFFGLGETSTMRLICSFCCSRSTRRLNRVGGCFCCCFLRSPGSNLRPLVYKASDLSLHHEGVTHSVSRLSQL